QAVSGAGGGGYDVMPARVVQAVIDSHHHVERALLDWRGDDHLAHAAFEMRRQGLGRQEFSRAFQHHFDARLIPTDFSRSRAVGKTDMMVFYREAAAICRNRYRPAAMDAVELEQMGGGIRAAFGLVDMDHRKRGISERGPQREAAHPSKTVDSYTHGHYSLPTGPEMGRWVAAGHPASFNWPISLTRRSTAKRSSVSI